MPKNNPTIKERLATLETEIKNFKERFDDFIDNDFSHLRARVDWILWVFILGTLASIAISLLKT